MRDVKLTVCFDESLQSGVVPAGVFRAVALNVSKAKKIRGMGGY